MTTVFLNINLTHEKNYLILSDDSRRDFQQSPMFTDLLLLPTESVDNFVDSHFKKHAKARVIWPSVRLYVF
jgi:hypothetical protein